MKSTNILNVFAILLTSLFFSEYAAAQSGPFVEIRNNSTQVRKICMYKNTDKVMAVPYKCFQMSHKEKVVWNRDGDRSDFKVKVFRPQKPKIFSPYLGDEYLYSSWLLGRTASIIIGAGSGFSSSQSPLKPAVTKYRLKVCNQRFNQEIYFAVSFETNNWFVTEGWWSVKKGKCVELAVSDRLKRSISLNYGNLPQTYYYAESYGDNPQFWAGGSSGRSLCVNDRKAFEIMLIRGPGGNPIPGACDQSGQKVVSFRRIDTPKTNQEYYYLTF